MTGLSKKPLQKIAMENKDDLLPYDYERNMENKGHTFGFVTSQKVRYQIRFKLTDYLFENVPELSWQTFEFIITPVFTPPGVKPQKDERVPVTVATIF